MLFVCVCLFDCWHACLLVYVFVCACVFGCLSACVRARLFVWSCACSFVLCVS